MKTIIRIISVCLALVLVCTAFAGCFGTKKKAPEKEVVDHVYKYETKDLISLEIPNYENWEDFKGQSYIQFTSLDAEGFLYTVETVNAEYQAESQIAYIGRYDSDEVQEIPLTVFNGVSGYRSIQNILRLEDGIMVIAYENTLIDEENYVYDSRVIGEVYGTDGTIRETLDFKKAFGMVGENEYLNIGQIRYANGELLLTLYTEDEAYKGKLIRMGMDGTIKGTISLFPEGKDGSASNILMLSDTKVCVPVELYGDTFEQKLMVIDLASGTAVESDAGDDYAVMYRSFGGVSGNLYYASEYGIYRIDAATGEQTELMNYINSDYIYRHGNFFALSDDQFLSIATTGDGKKNTLTLSTFTKVPDEELVPKYLITVASAGSAYSFREQIIEFNLASDEYRIKYVDYSQYNTDEDYTAGQTKLQNDIIAGIIPDVLITDQEFSASKYANKGLFVDLYTYMDKDPDMPRSAFLENVLKACETSGKLYEIPTNIYIMGFMGHKDKIGEYANLTMREFYEKVQRLPEDVSFFREGDYRREDMLEVFFFMNYVNFVNPTTGLCNLNNDDFKAILEYVGTLPEKSRWEMEDFDYETFDQEAYNNMFKDGKAIAEWTTLSTFEEFANYSYTFGDAELDFIGPPSPDRDGMVFTATNLKFLISAKGDFPEQAWEFVKVFFTEENQRELGWGFPVVKSALEAEKQEALDRVAEREAAKAEQDENTTGGTVSGGIVNEGGPLIGMVYPGARRETTREDIETIYSYVTNVKKQLLYDQNILDIIKEEASEYFAGKKSLDGVAAQAESRVNIKLGEAM